jgi:serine/threonine protein kinase
MKIVNLLNTNIIDESTAARGGQLVNNGIDIDRVSQLLNTKIDSRFNNLKYIGQGVNGEIYQIRADKEAVPYICKCIAYNPDNLAQVKRELGLLRSIQNYPSTAQYVNPCVGVVVTKDLLVSVFPTFNGVPLGQVKATLMEPGFKSRNRDLLVKYIIKQLLDAVARIHQQNVCHLQLDDNSVLIETREKFDLHNTTTPTSADQYEYNNENVNVSKLDIRNPTNMRIYKPEFDELDKPLRLKLTNFGIGCGKLIKTDVLTGDLDNVNSSISAFLRCNLIGCRDKYVADGLGSARKNSEYLALAKHYDTYLIGEIIKSLIYDPTSLTSPKLLNDTYIPYEDALTKWIFVPLADRKTPKFIQEKIILDEKHDYDSGF